MFFVYCWNDHDYDKSFDDWSDCVDYVRCINNPHDVEVTDIRGNSYTADQIISLGDRAKLMYV